MDHVGLVHQRVALLLFVRSTRFVSPGLPGQIPILIGGAGILPADLGRPGTLPGM